MRPAIKSARASAPKTGTGAVCSVCLEPIKKHKCVHYGAITCYSCRAFFRRTCIEKRAEEAGLAPKGPPKYDCKTGGRCGVVGSDRRKCRVCRFKRCLQVGMKPEQVLSQEEKEVRFKRFFKKKHEDEKDEGEVSTDALQLQYQSGEGESVGNPLFQEDNGGVPNDGENNVDPMMMLKSLKSEEIDQILSFVEQEMPGLDGNSMSEKSDMEPQLKSDKEISQQDEAILNNFAKIKTEEVSVVVKQEPVSKEDVLQQILDDLQTCETIETPPKKIIQNDNSETSKKQDCFKEAFWTGSLTSTTSQHYHSNPTFEDTGINFSANNYKVFSKASMMASMQHPDPGSSSSNCNNASLTQHFASREQFQWLTKLILAQYEGYLSMTPQFRTLQRSDQVTLHARNSKLFLMYALGRVFSSNTPQEQTEWIYGEDLSANTRKTCHPFVSFQSFANIFSSDHQRAAVGKLLDMSYDLKLTCPLPPNSKNLVALLLSFHMTDASDFVDPQTIKAINNHISTHLHLHHYPTLAKATQMSLLSILTVMSSTFDTFISCDLYQSSISTQEIAMPFTIEERLYLQRQLARYEEALKAVPCGEEICRQFLMFTYGAPPSPRFTSLSNKVFMERAKRVLQLHQEFASLSAQEQAYVWHANGSKAAMMAMLALEACQSGSQQLEMAFSKEDISDFHANFANSRHLQSQLCTLSISDMMPTAPKHVIGFYKDTARKLSNLSAASPNIQPLMLLLCLFSGTNLPQMTAVRRRYLLMLEREASCLAVDNREVLKGGVSIDEVRSGLGDVDKLSHMMRSLTIEVEYWPPETNAKSHEYCTDGQYTS